MLKRFTEWLHLKEKVHDTTHTPPFFKEGELWWCHTGENVGTEINGKGVNFTRPVLIFKKLSRNNFIGIPMTTQNRNGSWYADVTFRDRVSIVNLSQIRMIDYRRLLNRLGDLDEGDFERVKDKLRDLLAL